MISVQLPLRIVSEANQRGHWASGAKRAQEQRGITRLSMQSRGAWDLAATSLLARHTLRVTLGRIAPRRLDSDNLQRGLKAVRDGVADAMGIDDGDARVEWVYDQCQGAAKEYGCSIRIEVASIPDAKHP